MKKPEIDAVTISLPMRAQFGGFKRVMNNSPCLVWHLGSYEYPFYLGKLQVLFQTHLIESRLVLDAGCGPERRYLSNFFPHTWGVGLDIDRENLVKAKKANTSNNVLFVVGDIQNLPFVENVFDLVVCCDVLEHVEKPDKAVEELAMILRKKGRLLISTSNLLNPAVLIDTLLPNAVSKKIIHRFGGPSYYERSYRFNPWNLAKKLRKCGLSANSLTLGYPPIGKPWLYQFSKLKPPKIFYLWIVFDKLTNIKLLKKFKEVILAIAKK